MRQADSVSPTEETQDQRSAQTGFRPDIEGLRAVAVVAVVLFHADVPGVGGGFVGVDVFFVISGFLITGLLWREVSTTGTVRLRRFYGARARRLLPASATVGVVIMIGSAVLLPPLQARSVIGDGIASALYVSNYWFILQGVDYFGRHPAAVAVPALLVVGRRGAVLPGVAGLDHRHGVAHPACASAHQRAHAASSATPVSGGPCAGRGRVVRAVAGGHSRGASCGVLFAAHPGLAVGRRRPGGPHRRPVAPTTATALPRSRDGPGWG